MFFPLTVAATVLSLLAELPPLLQAPRERSVAAKKAAVMVDFAVLYTVDSCSFKDGLRSPLLRLLDDPENRLL